MAQQNIDFGTFPDDPSADAIRTAFQKVQQNFDEIFDSTANAAVLSVNRSQGVGITVDSPTGNVVVSANIASISVSSVTLKVGTSPNPVTNTATYTSYSQTLYVEIPDNLNIGNITANGFISATGNLTVANANLGNLATANFFSGNANGLFGIPGGNVTGTVATATTAGTVTTNAQPNITSVGNLTSLVVSGNITPTANITYNIGNNTNRFKDIYLSNSTIYLGDATVQSNATALIFTNPLGGQLVVSGNSTSYSNAIVNGTSNVDVYLDGNVAISVAGNANVFTVTGTGVNVNGSINSLDANLGNAVTANYFIGSGANLTNIPGANITGTANTANTAGTVTTNAQPNITSLGTLTSLSISGNANIGNIGTELITATGNITGANLITGGVISATGNANVGNIGATGGIFTNVTGALTTAAQPNITSTGTLASLSVSGNANIGNIGTAGLITATGNIGAGNLNTSGVVSATGNITGGNINTLGLSSASGNVIGGNLTTGGLVTAIGNVIGGNLETSGTLSVGGNANVGNIGATNGVFTSVTGTLTTASQPNITSTGTLASLSVSGNANFGNVSISGNLVAGNIQVDSIVNGNSNVDITNPNGNVTISVDGVNNIAVFTTTGAHIEGILIADNANLGNAANANYFIGNLYGTANTATTAGTVTTNAQPNITSLGNLSGLTVVGYSNLGNVGNVYIGGGASTNTYLTTDGLGNLSWGPINSYLPGGVNTSVLYNDAGSYGGDSNITFNKTTRVLSVNGNVVAGNITGTLTTAAQPNITSVGILTSLTVNTAGYIAAGTANIDGGNLNAVSAITAGTTLSVTGNANVGNIGGSAGIFSTIAGALTTASQPNVTAVGTLTSLSISGNANIGNIGTGGLITATGNVNAGNIITAGIVSATGNGTFGNVSATTFTGALSGAATTAGTVTTAAQPNITSVGTLTSLSSSGNVTGGNLFSAGTITANGGSYGEVVTTQYASVWGSGGGPNPYSIMQVRSSDGVSGLGMQAFTGTGTLYGNTNINFALGTIRDKDVPTSLVFKAYVDSTGFVANGIVSASGNVTGGNLITGGLITATGNITGGNIAGGLLTGTLSTASQPNITAVGTLASLSVSGNANVGNIGAGTGIYTTLSATGNITGANINGTFYGAGTGLTSIPGGNVTGTVPSATTAGTVTTNAQPNITSVGTLTGVTLANAAVISVGSNTNVGTLTGNFTLSAGSRLLATYA